MSTVLSSWLDWPGQVVTNKQCMPQCSCTALLICPSPIAQWLEHLQKASGSIPELGKNFSTFVTLVSTKSSGQTVYQCLTAPLEIASFSWKTPQIPSGSLGYSQTRGTTTPEALSLGWPSLRILCQYILLIQAVEHEFSQFVWNIVFATLPIISRVVLIAMMHIQFIHLFLPRSTTSPI